MALYHKWGVKTGFTFALQFFTLISDGIDGVPLCYRDAFHNGSTVVFRFKHVQFKEVFSI